MPGADAGADLHAARPSTYTCDVLVIGGGPSGSSAAYWLAEQGLEVLVVEKKHFPRDKTCGDGLTPRSVRQLYDMGLADELESHHRFEGLRALAFGKELILPWPSHSLYPSHGYVITRAELDALVATRAEKAGAVFWQGAEAVEPLGPSAGVGGSVLGAVVADLDHGTTSQVRATYVVVADGANSRFGRALGCQRDRSLPLGMALRGYYYSPRHAEPYIESHLDTTDKNGNVLPGYGWIFPVGDGRVNVGVGLVSSYRGWKDVNTSNLLAAFVESAPASWCLGPDTKCGPATGGRLPMGLSVGPRVGPDYVLVGDASGSINPFNGEGIAYGYETGRIAAECIADALRAGEAGPLADYEARLDTTYGTYYAVASSFMNLMGRPRFMRGLVATGMHSRVVMGWLLRIMSNLLRPESNGPPELVYRAATRVLALRRRRAALG